MVRPSQLACLGTPMKSRKSYLLRRTVRPMTLCVTAIVFGIVALGRACAEDTSTTTPKGNYRIIQRITEAPKRTYRIVQRHSLGGMRFVFV